MKIILAEYSGYCYGVERALKIAKEAADEDEKKLYSLGPIIHNTPVIEKLREEKDIHPVENLSEVEHGRVLIRAHGASPQKLKEAEDTGNDTVDATCPFVNRAQVYAEELHKEGYRVIILGETNHPEVVALRGYAKDNVMVVEDPGELPEDINGKKIGVVVQTTQKIEKLQELVKKLLPVCEELKVHNTICEATTQRQEAAKEVARKCDLMLVIGDKMSGNTRRLAQICSEVQPFTKHIVTLEELDENWLEGVETVGVTAGASTPDFSIREVIEFLKGFEDGGD